MRPCAVSDTTVNSESIIELSNLRFGWKPGELVLDIDRLEIAAGCRLFLMGPSGSGKTTLLNLLGGVVAPRDGEIRVLGERLERLGQASRDRFRADHIGFIFQQFNLIPYLDVLENTMLPMRFSPARRARLTARGRRIEEEARRLLSELGLTDERIVGRKASEISVGQQQRVAAARALIGSPEIVIADEPTSSLDVRHRESFLGLVEDECARSGATLVFVSHDPSLGALFDRRVDLPDINRAAREYGVLAT